MAQNMAIGQPIVNQPKPNKICTFLFEVQSWHIAVCTWFLYDQTRDVDSQRVLAVVLLLTLEVCLLAVLL